jgi:uncharacterized protein (DUF1697 family)
MPKYVAFLRGMNLGKRRVTNAELEKAFKALKFENVATFIASGNIIFDSRAGEGPLVKTLEAHLEESFGYPVPTFLRTTAKLAEVAEVRPFAASRHQSAKAYVVGFLAAKVTPAQKKTILGFAGPNDEFHVEDREVYWLSQTLQSESPVFKIPFDKRAGVASTWRNMNTVQRLLAKYSA